MNDDAADIHEFPHARPRVKKLRLLLVLAGLSLLALVSTAFGMMMAVASDLPSLENREEYKNARNSVLVDVHGKRLGILTSPENRILVRSDEIAPAMKRAVIAIEDKRYYKHEGVDLKGVGRALVQDIIQRKAAQGGSTIPQQFVKNALKAQADRTVFQKLRESALAFHLDRKWSKEKILTEYLNAIYFGNGAYGVESAARTYFGQEPHHVGCGDEDRRCAAELKPEEAALLAGMIASPSLYDPVSRRKSSLERRNLVLDRMAEQGYISPEEAKAGSEDAGPGEVQPPRESSVTPAAPYFTTWVKQQVVDRYTARRAFTGGLEIRTTLDLEMQKAAENAVSKWLGWPGAPTVSLVAIDNDTGEVRAMLGGRDYNEAPFNLATQGQRQPGSAFKPFILATALDQGISSGSTWSSQKLQIRRKGCDFEVNNYEGSYAGASSLARATTFSDNAVYAQVGLEVGTKNIAKTAKKMGIRTPISTNCAMTLGGLKEGVTPLDMAHAYQTFATGGQLVTGSLGPDKGPVGIREVCRMDRDGECDKRVARNKPQRKRVLSQGVADESKNILSTVVTSGTANRAQLDRFAAGKTGTTENYGDAWFVGFTDELTVAVWVGYPDKVRPMETEYRGQPVAGGTYPADIWRDFMVAALAQLDERSAKEREEKGLPPEDATTGAVPPPAAPTPQTAEPALEEPPAPTGGDPRPEEAPVPTPPAQTPAPAPTPAAPPPTGGGTGGGGAAPAGGTGAPPGR